MAAGVTPRCRRYRCTAWPPPELPAIPLPPAAGGTMRNTLMLCPAADADASRVPPGLNCSAASGEVCARKWATGRRLAASRTTTVPATAASACKGEGPRQRDRRERASEWMLAAAASSTTLRATCKVCKQDAGRQGGRQESVDNTQPMHQPGPARRSASQRGEVQAAGQGVGVRTSAASRSRCCWGCPPARQLWYCCDRYLKLALPAADSPALSCCPPLAAACRGRKSSGSRQGDFK